MIDIEIKLLVRDIANQIIADLKKNIRERRVTEFGAMNNTGQAAESLRWKIEGDNLVIYSTMSGFNYIMTLETGRKPGRRPPVEPIERWLKQRGIQPMDISQKSLAYLIARRIGRDGTKVYQDYTAKGKGTGILLDVIGNPAYIEANVRQPIIDKLAERFTAQMQGV